jgi:hypothetical protein
MTMIIDGTNGITFPDTSRQYNSYYNFKNRIINGAMVIDQRNNGASITPTSIGNTYGVDRWNTFISQSSKFSMQRNAGAVTPPAGYTNYLGITSLSAYSVLSSDLFVLRQFIEGFNIADLGWGTANAQTVTLSFWVRSSLTGTFGGAINNSSASRSYPFSYTISSANTWEQKSITIAGDTTGTWATDNTLGLQANFSLGAGSSSVGTAGAWSGSAFYSATGATSVVGTNGATFYITGVQLEEGIVSTPFDFRPYTTELQLAQRYYYRLSPGATSRMLSVSGQCATSTAASGYIPFPVTMRTRPTSLEQTGTASNYAVFNSGTGTVACNTVPVFNAFSTDGSAMVDVTVASGLSAGNVTLLFSNNSAAYLGWSAEL